MTMWTYHVTVRDIRPDGADEHRIKVAAPDARTARKAAENLSDLGLRLRGIARRGTIVAVKAERGALWGKS